MNNNYPQIQELLHQKADYQARLNLLPYDGTPEVKEDGGKKYLYVRKRIGSRLSSTYVDVYSDTLYQLLLRNARDAKEYRKNIRRLDKELAQLGYTDQEISLRVQLNLDFARANMKSNIYDQAILEGVTTSFPQTEDIIDNGIMLTGGGSLLRGLASYIAGELHVDVAIAPDPLNCVARGTAISLSEGRYLTAGFRDATPKAWHKRLQNNHDPFAGE